VPVRLECRLEELLEALGDLVSEWDGDAVGDHGELCPEGLVVGEDVVVRNALDAHGFPDAEPAWL
jgi:hypothetical protein